MIRSDRSCAYCAHFSLKAAPEQAAHGIGACLGYDAPVEPFVRWDGPFCVLFRKAADLGARRQYVQRQMTKQQEVA